MSKKIALKKLTVDIITLFPDFINHYQESFGILQKARVNNQLDVRAVNLREFGLDARGTVDDRPYGGGVGMVLRPDVVYGAIKKVVGLGLKGYGLEKSKIKNQKSKMGLQKPRVVMLSARGKRFTQKEAQKLSKYEYLVFVCGRYEGIDERVSKFVDDEYSVGDYVLMGGELPALVITEAVARLVPGVLGKLESTENESFSSDMLEYPQYTKPEVWEVGGKKYRVPKVLLSGDHGKVDVWRDKEALKRTKKFRGDLLIE